MSISHQLTDSCLVAHGTISTLETLKYTTFYFTDFQSTNYIDPSKFIIYANKSHNLDAEGKIFISESSNIDKVNGAHYYAFLIVTAIYRRASEWYNNTLEGDAARRTLEESIRQGTVPTADVIRYIITANYISYCQQRHIQPLTFYDLTDRGAISNPAVSHFTPSINVLYVWEKFTTNSNSVSSGSGTVKLNFSVSCNFDFLSDVMLTLNITAPDVSRILQQDPRFSLPENVPYVRMASDPLSLILKEFQFRSIPSHILLQETGVGLLVHNELTSCKEAQGRDRVAGNQEVKYAVPKADNYGISHLDANAKKLVYTDGLQTPVPAFGYDSLLYTKNGDPKVVSLTLPLRPYFAARGMAIPAGLLGTHSNFTVIADLHNLQNLFTIIPRGLTTSLNLARLPVTTVEGSLDLRTATFPPQIFNTFTRTTTQFITTHRHLYDHDIPITQSTGTVQADNSVRVMINSIVCFAAPSSNIFFDVAYAPSSDIPREIAGDLWSSLENPRVEERKELEGLVPCRLGNISNVLIPSTNDSIIPYSSDPFATSLIMDANDEIMADTVLALYDADVFTDPKAKLLTTFTIGMDPSAPAPVHPLFAAFNTESAIRAAILGGTVGSLPEPPITVHSRSTIFSSTVPAADLGRTFFIARLLPKEKVYYHVKKTPVINSVDFTINGNSFLAKELTQSVSDAALVSDGTFSTPSRRGIFVINFGNEKYNNNSANGFVQAAPSVAKTTFRLNPDYSQNRGSIPYRAHVLTYCNNVAISTLGNYELRFGNIGG